jgi:D-xylose transport system ATP-binding protein
MSDRTPLLELKEISKRFGAVQALAGVCFDVFPNEVVALVGDNGAGKSTLIKIIAGIYPADEGTVLWEGRRVTIRSPNDSMALGIATVYQDLALCDNLDVVGNLFLGRETARPSGPLGVMDEVEMETRAVAVLRQLGVTIPDVRIPMAALSGGQRQSVAVARSVMWDNKVVFLDEPTAALGVAQTREVLDLVRRLAEKGHGVVIVSHNLADVFEVADRISVLRLGRRVGTYKAAQVTREHLVGLMTGAVAGPAEGEESGERRD